MLHDFIAHNRAEITQRCRAKARTRSASSGTTSEIDRRVQVFLDQLNDALHLPHNSSGAFCRTATNDDRDLIAHGFAVSKIVHDYTDICHAIADVAVELSIPISTDDFRTLNRCLGAAIGSVIAEYGHERTQLGIDGEPLASERLAFFAHEMRNVINTAIAAHAVVKTGNVGISASAVLERSLTAARVLIDRSLADIRLTRNLQNRELFTVAEFAGEVASAASLETSARSGTFTVMPVEDDIAILADRQVLAAVVGNLLQNAFKFTRPCTTVTLRVRASVDRVRIEVEDECGGLPGGNHTAVFLPYEQRSANRKGLGLGLAFSRWGAEANDGQLYARDLPGRGCVFTVDLPRAPARHAAR